MPWDGCELWVADVAADGALHNPRKVAGGLDESIFQPEWSADNALYFVSDRTNWWNLYRASGTAIEALCPMNAEFGGPLWNLGYRMYGFISATQIFCTYFQNGFAHLAVLDVNTHELRKIETSYNVLGRGGLAAANGKAVVHVASPTQGFRVAVFDAATGQFTVLKTGGSAQVDEGYLSTPHAIAFPTEHGQTAHAFFYPPRNKDYAVAAPTQSLSHEVSGGDAGVAPNAGVAHHADAPPLLVMSHGGPTSATLPALSLSINYWTSRGIAVLDVNYGGSTGYGRAYRQRLNGTWGITDVDDCVNGAKFLAQQGWVDGARLMITGGSAGGYTTLCALAFRTVFKAGASHFGVSDAEALAKDTHKFESHYLDNLIGPYPERRDVYVARSPIHFVHQISAPLILLQGLEDAVVPPSQSEKMFEAVRAREIPTAYLTFEGEQHGFRQAKNIKRALEAELYFYARVFGFALADADEIEPVAIENLD
jgi:dipeptidyl aminopeptidase/acylaminoacyl peptidase